MVDSFYSGKSVLVTGSTGFIGKVLIEKLLFSLPQIKAVYLLIRPSKTQTIQERFQKLILESPCFSRIQNSAPETLTKKLIPISGDLTQERVIFDSEFELEIIQNVEIIFHCAASVAFKERFDRILQQNTLGTMRVLSLAKRCKKIASFVHVSTAYVNSDKPSGYFVEKSDPV
jgi:thioester reductase-like protein